MSTVPNTGSVVPHSGPLRYLYDTAQADDIEWKDSAFWQKFMQIEFNSQDRYSVLAEQSPDGSRRRVDLTVLEHGHYGETITLIVLEARRRGNSDIGKLETDTLDAATRYLTFSGAAVVYAMSTWGTKARCWYVQRAPSMELVPMFGEGKGSRREYVDADSSKGFMIAHSCRYIRGEIEWEDIETQGDSQ